MVTRFTLPHIDISSRALTRPYQADQESWGGRKSVRDREAHGRRLQAELAAAFEAADDLRPLDRRLEPATGVYLEVELRRGDKPDDALERRSAGVRPGATRTEENQASTIALYV